MQIKFKVTQDVKLEELEAKLNELAKSGQNVVQVLPIIIPAYANSLQTTLSIVTVDGQPWLQQPDTTKDASVEEKVS